MCRELEFPKTLQQAVKYFGHGDNALNFMVSMRWPNGAICPRCRSDRNSFISTRQTWECKGCRKQFSVKVGTIFEDSPIKLDKWMCALWMLSSAKNGISSHEIHRSLGVTQKTGWFMLQRLRLALQSGSIKKMSGHVEADETFIGAKARNMHRGRRKAKGRGPVAMTAVMGLLERAKERRASRVKLRVLKTTRKPELQGEIKEHVTKGTEIHTDSLRSYQGLDSDYVHKVVDHAVAYVQHNVHTNGMENFWSLLKRTIKGTYICPSPFHLFRYLDEQAFRFNERKDCDKGRFVKAIKGVFGKGLRYIDLIGGVDGLPAAG